MVDFQSRDTGRDRSTDEDEDEAADADSGTSSDASESGTESDAADGDTSDVATESDSDEGETGTGDSPDSDNGERSGSDYVDLGAEHDSKSDAPDDVDHAQKQAQESHDHSHDHDEHSHDHGEHSHGAHDHGPTAESLGVALITVSSSRTIESDPSGDEIRDSLEAEDHDVVERDLVADDLDGVQRAVLAVTDREDVDVVITTGGTGVTPDDVTIEAVQPLFDKKLPGFGELFRILSYEEVGTRALGSRATAGISEGVPVFCLPGSENAVRLGTESLILPEMGHLVGLANRSH